MPDTKLRDTTQLPDPPDRERSKPMSSREREELLRYVAATKPAFEAARSAFEAQMPEIRKQYAGEWVLFYDARVRQHASCLSDLARDIRNAETVVIVEYVPRPFEPKFVW